MSNLLYKIKNQIIVCYFSNNYLNFKYNYTYILCNYLNHIWGYTFLFFFYKQLFHSNQGHKNPKAPDRYPDIRQKA